VGARGGVDAVAHAVVTALEADEQHVALSIDCENAFNRLCRDAMFRAVKKRLPELLPLVQWAYGAGTPLFVVGAAAGTEPIWSLRGTRQGDPGSPLLFGLTIQDLLDNLAATVPRAPTLGYLDDLTAVGRVQDVQDVFQILNGDGPNSLRSVGLKLRHDKSGVFGGRGLPDSQQHVAALAATLGVKHCRAGLTIVGVPIGTDDYVQSELAHRARKVVALVHKCTALPLSKQTQFLLLRGSLSHRMAHLQRTVDWRHLAASTMCAEQAVISAAAEIFRLPAGEGPWGRAPLPCRALEQLLLPTRHAGFGLRISSARGAKAAFLSGAASAQLLMKDAPQVLRPLDGPNRAALLTSWHELFEDCGADCDWPEAVRGFSVTAVSSVLPVVQRDVARCIADRQGKAFLDSWDCTTEAGKRAAARLRSSASAPGSAWLTATPGPTTRLGDETFVVCGRHRMGLGVPTTVDPPPCLCGAGCASTPDHAMLCKHVAKMTQLRHDIVVSAVRRVISRASCPSSLEPPYRHLRAQQLPHAPPAAQAQPAAPAQLQPQQQHPPQAQGANPAPPVQPQPRRARADPGLRRGDIMAILPGGQIDILDIVVAHTARRDYLGQSCTRAGYAAQRAADDKVRDFKKFGDAGQYEFVPFAVESYGRLGVSAQNFLKRMGDVAAGRGKISRSAFVKSAYREVSCALQRGIGMMYARSTVNLARASGRHFMPGCDVPVQEEALL
jgi:hypothetical protein